MTTPSNARPRSTSRASPWTTCASCPFARTFAYALIRASVSSVYRRRNGLACATGRHSRLCLWHQYGPRCGTRGKSRSKCVVQPRRSRGACEDHAQDVVVLVLVEELAERQELARGPRSEPLADVTRTASCSPATLQSRHDVAQFTLEHEEVVAPRLHAHQQAVERGDVHTRRVEAGLERLHERGPRAGERVEHVPAARDVPLEQRLDELWDELAEVRMQPVDVARSLALGKVALRPRELEVDLGVQGVLRGGHGASFAPAVAEPPRTQRHARSSLPAAFGHDVEANGAARVLRMRREPRGRRSPQAPYLLGRDHLERIAEAGARLRLHLAEDERRARAGRRGRARSRRSRRSRRGCDSRAGGSAYALCSSASSEAPRRIAPRAPGAAVDR